MKDFLVPNSPSASLRSAPLAAARSLAALTAHRAVIHYRSLGCGFALPTPYTGEAYMRRLFVIYYQLNSIINLSTTNLKLITLSSYMSVILRSCKARLLPSAAKQNSILNRAAVQ